jgi:hypothetical protein
MAALAFRWPRAGAFLGGAACAGSASALSALFAPRGEVTSTAPTAAAYTALGGASALTLSVCWHDIAPRLILEHGYPLRAYALRSFVFYTGVVPPVLAATVWATTSIDRSSREHLPAVYAQVVGSSWILAAGCHSAYHLALEQSAARRLIAAALLAGLVEWAMIIGTTRQDWREFGLEAVRERRTAMTRWRTQVPEQQKVPVSVAIRDDLR